MYKKIPLRSLGGAVRLVLVPEWTKQYIDRAHLPLSTVLNYSELKKILPVNELAILAKCSSLKIGNLQLGSALTLIWEPSPEIDSTLTINMDLSESELSQRLSKSDFKAGSSDSLEEYFTVFHDYDTKTVFVVLKPGVTNLLSLGVSKSPIYRFLFSHILRHASIKETLEAHPQLFFEYVKSI